MNNEPTKRLIQTLSSADRTYRRSLKASAGMRSAQIFVLVTLILTLLDMFFTLPLAMRWVGFAFLIGIILHAATVLLFRYNKSHDLRRIARLIEMNVASADNALINAVQFANAPTSSSAIQTAVINQTISDGAQIAFENYNSVVPREEIKTALRRIIWLTASLSAFAILLPSIFFTIAPRVFAPWMDAFTPPFSFVKFNIEPKNIVIAPNEPLAITAAITGNVNRSVYLQTFRRGEKPTKRFMENNADGTFSLTLDSLSKDTYYTVSAGSARSKTYLIDVSYKPKISSVKAVIEYPKHINRPSTIIEQAGSEIRTLAGAEVRLLIFSDCDLKAGSATLQMGNSQQVFKLYPKQNSPNEIAFDFILNDDGECSLELISSDGELSETPRRIALKAEKDQKPTVVIESPTGATAVQPDSVVHIAVAVNDDYGITHAEVKYKRNNQPEQSITINLADKPKSVNASVALNLNQLNAVIGDTITYYATATDNAPGASNLSVTNKQTLKVVSKDEYNNLLANNRTLQTITEDMNAIRTALSRLEAEQSALAQSHHQLSASQSRLDNSQRKQTLNKLVSRQQEFQRSADELAKQLQAYAQSPSGSEFETRLKEILFGISIQLQSCANEVMQKAQSQSIEQNSTESNKAADELRKITHELNTKLFSAINAAQSYVKLMQDISHFKELSKRQSAAADECNKLSIPSAPSRTARLKQLEKDQSSIELQLRKLTADFKRHASSGNKSFLLSEKVARTIADDVEKRLIAELMSAVKTLLQQQAPQSAYSYANRADKELKEIIKSCEMCSSMSDKALGSALSSVVKGSGKQVQEIRQWLNKQTKMKPISNDANSAVKPYSAKLLIKPLFARKDPPTPRPAHQNGGINATVEKLPSSQNQTSGASMGLDNNAPPQYRLLVNEYFKAVSKDINKKGGK